MGRPKGSRNPQFEAQRKHLIELLEVRLRAHGGATASFRELAAAAGVSVATLRHYFNDRAGVLAAVLGAAHEGALGFLHTVAAAPLPPVEESLGWYLGFVRDGLRDYGLLGLHELGLAAGVGDPTNGSAYLEHVLEPSLQALEARLARHVASGELRPLDPRLAALQLLSPLLVALLHQDALDGARCRPLDVDALLAPHLASFLRAYGSGDAIMSSARATKRPTKRPRAD